MTASLSDILTAAKNIATAMNGVANAELYLAGKSTSIMMVTGTHLIATGSGWVSRISVAETGGVSAVIGLYDSSSATIIAGKGLAQVTVASDGILDIRMPFALGLVAVIPASAKIRVSYSLNQDVR